MKLVPLLALQRGIYDIPTMSRKNNRFQAYLDTMLVDNRQDIRYPWSHMNPMAKSHIPDLLDQLIEMKVEEEIQNSVSSLLFQQQDHKPRNDEDDWSVGLVVVDDVLGGWTDRIDVEFQNSFQQVEPLLQRGWVEVIIWASDYYDYNCDDPVLLPPLRLEESNNIVIKEKLLQSTERSIYRSLYHHHQRDQQQNNNNNNVIQTLGDMMDQESWVQEQLLQQQLHPTKETSSSSTDSELMEDVETSLNMLREYENATIDESFPTVIAAYYGDEAAKKCGYPSLGITKTNYWNGQRICESGLWKKK